MSLVIFGLSHSKLRLTLRPSLLRSAVNQGTRIVTLQELSKAVAAAYIERTIRGTNPRPTVDVGLITSRVRPRRVRPVRWQIKGCQTTEPRTFDSGFSGKVNLSTLGFNGTPTYLLTTQCVPCYLVRVSPLCTTKLDTPSLTRRSSSCQV